MTDPAAIGERIADLRKFRRMSMQAVADAAGITKAHICHLERGQTVNPGVVTLERVARALGTSLAYLLGYETAVLDPFPHKLALLIDARIRETSQ